MGTIIDYEYRHADRLRASPNNRVVTRPSEKFEGNYYMQNKPNFKPNYAKTNPNRTQFQPKNEANKPKTNPILSASGGLKSRRKEVRRKVCSSYYNKEDTTKAGDGIRTHDIQLGKLAFYR